MICAIVAVQRIKIVRHFAYVAYVSEEQDYNKNNENSTHDFGKIYLSLYLSSENKKCAAEATHEKHIAPIAATQLRQTTRECEKGECVFTEDKNTSLVVCSMLSCVAQIV